MATPEHVEVVRSGARALQEWREQNPLKKLNLVQADLSGSNLSHPDLSG